jgi:hypothetical protein
MSITPSQTGTSPPKAPAPFDLRLLALVLILVLGPVLIRFVMPDCASYRCADCSMMAGDMSGHPASNRTLGTALGVGWYRRQRDEKRQSAGQYNFH